MLDILKRKLHPFTGYRGLFDCDCACADYSGVAAASSQANAISEKLGTDQLNEAKRQYDLNMEVAKPVVDAQLEQMKANTEQAKDYYDNWKTTYQPLEQGLVEDVNKASDPDYIEGKANTAMADARQGTTQQQNQLIRQGLRYGYSPSRLAAMAGSSATQTGLGIASAANQARDKATDTAYAKKLDVAGLGRGLTGAANGAYTSALNAGNSAVGNNAQAGNALLNGMAQGTGTIQNGMGMQINGLLGAANGQQAAYNAMSGGDSGLGGLGSLLGGAASAYKAFSDRRLKREVDLVGKDTNTDLNLYEFSYIDDPDEKRYIGVMADEVEPRFPAAVEYDDLGFASVDYGMLGIEFKEIQ